MESSGFCVSYRQDASEWCPHDSGASLSSSDSNNLIPLRSLKEELSYFCPNWVMELHRC
jgi:hypothetical protein